MPNHRFNWHEHIKSVEREYHVVRLAMDRLIEQAQSTPDQFSKDQVRNLREANARLEGTYLVRLFAAFEAALRSYDRARYNDPNRTQPASILIDEIGGRHCRRISHEVREVVHEVRRLRNFWAHEGDALPQPMTLGEARGRLQKYLSRLPNEWA